MSFKVQVRRAAELDVGEAQVWYETQRAGLGADFHSEISEVFTVLTENPLIYPALYRDVRRAIVHRFPYLIWYRVLGEEGFSAVRTLDRTPARSSLVSVEGLRVRCTRFSR